MWVYNYQLRSSYYCLLSGRFVGFWNCGITYFCRFHKSHIYLRYKCRSCFCAEILINAYRHFHLCIWIYPQHLHKLNDNIVEIVSHVSLQILNVVELCTKICTETWETMSQWNTYVYYHTLLDVHESGKELVIRSREPRPENFVQKPVCISCVESWNCAQNICTENMTKSKMSQWNTYQILLNVHESGDAEICQLRVKVSIQEDILRLHI